MLEPGYLYTDGEDAGILAAECGLAPYPWQQSVLNAWLGRDEKDNLTAQTCGLAVPRQNGKNAIIEMRELYGLCVQGEHILHTAHQVKTSAKSFERLRGYFQDDRNHPELAAMVENIRLANGQESIRLKNGGLIEFSARSRGASRGFTTNLVVFDEAQELTDEQLEAILPTISASNESRQIIYTGTPPGPNSPGTVFGRTRENVIKNDPKNTCWHEWSVEEIGDVADRERWYATNPSMGYRLTEEWTENEFMTMSKDGFARERLGWWSASMKQNAISQSVWDANYCEHPRTDGIPSFGVKIAPSGEVALGVCAKYKDDTPPHVELVETRSLAEGVAWLANWLTERKDKFACVVIDGQSGIDALVSALIANKVARQAIRVCNSRDMIAACSRFNNALVEHNVTHYGQPPLTDAALGARKRPIGNDGGYGWGPVNLEVDVVPLEAVTLAYYGAMTSKRVPGRRAIIL